MASGTYSPLFLKALFDLCFTLTGTLTELEKAMRQFHPPRLPRLWDVLQELVEPLRSVRERFSMQEQPEGIDELLAQVDKAATHTANCLDLFTTPVRPEQALAQIMRAMRQHQRAQEALFPLCRLLPPVNSYFLEAPVRGDGERFLQDPCAGVEVGLMVHGGTEAIPNDYCLYVPETYDGSQDRPLVVALHGGRGSGRDFVWVWLREARSRGFLLLAPSSSGPTWSFATGEDARALRALVRQVAHKWRVDPRRILLTGMSDGAIYTLTCGLEKDSPYTALAPIAGLLHPIDLTHARGKRIYMVHGTLDWMFPVHYAQQACAILKKSGADVAFRQIEDLSHTYPREENDRILCWFDPSLALHRAE